MSLPKFNRDVATLETTIKANGEITLGKQLAIPFGLVPPENIIQVWGARAIFKRGMFSLIWDRKGATHQEGVSRQRQNLFGQFVNIGLKQVAKLAKNLGTHESRLVEFQIGRYQIKANPLSSYGYLYIVAFELPLVEPDASNQ